MILCVLFKQKCQSDGIQNKTYYKINQTDYVVSKPT